MGKVSNFVESMLFIIRNLLTKTKLWLTGRPVAHRPRASQQHKHPWVVLPLQHTLSVSPWLSVQIVLLTAPT